MYMKDICIGQRADCRKYGRGTVQKIDTRGGIPPVLVQYDNGTLAWVHPWAITPLDEEGGENGER